MTIILALGYQNRSAAAAARVYACTPRLRLLVPSPQMQASPPSTRDVLRAARSSATPSSGPAE
jgi:hypothetical protein